MDRVVPTLIIVGIILLAIVGMYLGWRALVRKSAAFEAPAPVPDTVGEQLAVAGGLYVATTLAGKPLERVAAHGLGFRARATVMVSRAGITVELTGRAEFFIARAALLEIATATWAIDKAVEPEGLVVVTWKLGDTQVDSYFRIDGGSEILLRAGADVIEGLE